MKICFLKNRAALAFTLPELMIAMSLLMVVLGGVISSHIFGLRMFEITKAKLGSNQDARRAISRLTQEIRSAKWIQVGQGSATSFEPVEDGEPQQGNALQIYSTADTEPYIRYFLDTSSNNLLRLTSTNQTLATIAQSVSNHIVFSSENSQGIVLTNNENNRVIGLNLQFYQIQFPITKIGPGEYFDFYQLRTRVTRRSLE